MEEYQFFVAKKGKNVPVISFLIKKYLLYVKKYLWLFVSQMCVFPRNKGIVPGANFAPPSRIFTCFVFSALAAASYYKTIAKISRLSLSDSAL